MGRGGAFLGPPDVQERVGEVDLVPAQVHQLTHSETMAIRDQDHGGVAVPPTAPAGHLEQLLDLGLGQVFPGAELGIGRRLGVTVRLTVVGATTRRADFINVFRAGWR